MRSSSKTTEWPLKAKPGSSWLFFRYDITTLRNSKTSLFNGLAHERATSGVLGVHTEVGREKLAFVLCFLLCKVGAIYMRLNSLKCPAIKEELRTQPSDVSSAVGSLFVVVLLSRSTVKSASLLSLV